MTKSCPVNFEIVNERVTRFNALYTLLALMIFFAFPNQWLLMGLAADFLLRTYQKGKYSLVAFLSRTTVAGLRLSPATINAGPKVFAAKIGLFMITAAWFAWFMNYHIAAMIISGIVVLFAFLEFAFGICVACKIYPVYKKMFYK
ncbi:MAG TPA: DUF4395 domain-containing protein [Bacteroidales bacterium]|nr:DUF4395 domain-containing protein [Bacteroidales bacterium]